MRTPVCWLDPVPRAPLCGAPSAGWTLLQSWMGGLRPVALAALCYLKAALTALVPTLSVKRRGSFKSCWEHSAQAGIGRHPQGSSP